MNDEQIIEAAISEHASTRDAIKWAMDKVRRDAVVRKLTEEFKEIKKVNSDLKIDESKLLSLLGKTKEDFGRFRVAFLDGDYIVVKTRNGGGNREQYQSVFDEMAMHPLYSHDEDNDFDCTYASIYFHLPPDEQPVAWIYTSKLGGHEEYITRYASELTTYKADKVTPLYLRPAHAVVRQLVEALEQLRSIVKIHSAATSNNFAWAEMDFAKEALAAFAKATGGSDE